LCKRLVVPCGEDVMSQVLFKTKR